MQEMIGRDTFDELARTGRIGLDPEEAEELRLEMNRQMEVIRQLEAIPLEDMADPVIHGNPYPEAIRCGLREDIVKPFDNASAIINEAPLTHEGYIISPDVAHRKIG